MDRLRGGKMKSKLKQFLYAWLATMGGIGVLVLIIKTIDLLVRNYDGWRDAYIACAIISAIFTAFFVFDS